MPARAGCQVLALDSVSGWATLSDREGRFLLPDVVWYRGATYELILSTDGQKGQRVRLAAPLALSSTATIAAGRLPDSGDEVIFDELMGLSYISYEDYDFDNRDIYRGLYEDLTAKTEHHQEKIDAAVQFKFNSDLESKS